MKFKSISPPKSLNFLFFFIIGFSFSVFSQEEHAWVYFNDKPNSDAGINNPISILTQKAIARKQARNVPIDFRDVPVDENYISEVKAQAEVTVLAKSKWFNSVHVRGTLEGIKNLENLSTVREVIFADRSLNFRTGSVKSEQPSNVVNKLVTVNRLTEFEYGDSATQIEMIKGDYLHLEDFTGEGMTIAVMDGGFANVNTMDGFSRLRDNGKLMGGYDFVDRNDDVFEYTGNSHGTQVLSCMAGFKQDRFVGTAPDASYYLFRTEKVEDETPLEESLWVEAVERADSLGVDVINTSLGYREFDNPNYNYSDDDLDGDTAFITKGANIGFEKGLLLITSAGNSGAKGLGVPADSPGVFSIAAVDHNGIYATFSSQGSEVQPTQKPDVAAQGSFTAVIDKLDRINTAFGTSFSSPILAGSITCLWQALPNLSNAEIMQLVRLSSSKFDSPDFRLGFGIPDFELALNGQLSTNDSKDLAGLAVFPNPASNKINVSIPENVGAVKLQLFNVLGKKVKERSISKGNTALDLADLSKGVYVLRFNSKKAAIAKKIIIK